MVSHRQAYGQAGHNGVVSSPDTAPTRPAAASPAASATTSGSGSAKVTPAAPGDSELLRPDTSLLTAEAERRGAQARSTATKQEAMREQPSGRLRRFARFIADVWRKGDRDRVLGLAAEMAFFAMLTLFPALLVIAAILGQLGNLLGEDLAASVEEEVVRVLQLVLTDSASGAVDAVRALFVTGGNALTLASGLALLSIVTGFAVVINALNLTYDTHETRGWWYRRLLGLLLGLGTILMAALVLTAVVVGPLLGPAEQVVTRIGLDEEYAVLWSVVRWPVAFVALVLWATTLCHVSPARRTPFRYDLPGGLFTAVLWLAASYGFNIYLRVVVPGNPVLGSLGGGLLLLTWLYLLSLFLLAGAEGNAVLQARRRVRRGEPAL